MFNSDKSPIQIEIDRHRAIVDKQLKTLQESLDKLVYWETLYNKENKINTNSANLYNLIVVNDLLKEETPECYFIEQPEIKGSVIKRFKKKMSLEQIEIAIPSIEDLSKIDSLSHTKTEIFLLRNNMPGTAQKTITKIDSNGKYEFILKTKHKNIEEERIIDAKEYLLLTTQIDVNISRISTTIYSFIYNKNKYNIIINNTEKSAILEYYKSAPVPDFVKLKV